MKKIFPYFTKNAYIPEENRIPDTNFVQGLL